MSTAALAPLDPARRRRGLPIQRRHLLQLPRHHLHPDLKPRKPVVLPAIGHFVPVCVQHSTQKSRLQAPRRQAHQAPQPGARDPRHHQAAQPAHRGQAEGEGGGEVAEGHIEAGFRRRDVGDTSRVPRHIR